MKKVFLYCIAASVAFASCKKDKTVFSESPDQRINKLLTSYQDTLANAPNGWKGFIFPSGLEGGVVGFYFKFNNANRVEMFSDFDSLSAVTVMQSSFRLKAVQQPVLIFDTYCYVTVLSDPDAGKNGGSYGSGLSSDFEFAIDSVKGDTIRLTGRLHGSKAFLVRATKQEMDDFYNKKHTNRLFNHINDYLTYFKRITVGGITYEVLADTTTRTATITWTDNNGPHVLVTGFYYTTTGIGFATPVVSTAGIIYGFDNVGWNGGTRTMTLSVNGVGVTVAPSIKPLMPDVNAARNWWNYPLSNTGNWLTVRGYHINGVDDALGLHTISNFYYLTYEPGGGTYLDAMGLYQVIRDTLHLDFAPLFNPPSFIVDGRMTFKFNRNYVNANNPPLSPADSTIMANTRIQTTDAQGYWFVRKSATMYDMVGAKDAQAWIRWYFQ